MKRVCAALLCAASLSACGPKLGAAAAPSRAAPLTALQQTIARVLADPSLERGTWGIAIHSLDRGDTLFTLNPRKLLLPASTLKVITLAAAADRLDWDYTFETRLYAHGQLEAGFLDGDLVVVGSGDPSLDDWDGTASHTFSVWSEQLRNSGVRAVGGRIVGDDDTFDDVGLGSGWQWDDLTASYAAGVGALQFNENTAQVVVEPGSGFGMPARVTLTPPSAVVSLRNMVTTALAGAVPMLRIAPSPRGGSAEVRGQIALDATPLVRNVAVNNPTLYLTNAIRDALITGGIEVGGAAADIDDLAAGLPRSDGVLLLTHHSPPLSVLAATMMKDSQNLYGETLLKAVGARTAGLGSAETGRAAVLATLDAWGVGAGDLVLADGSGLSRYNLVTADALVMVLSHVYRDERLRDPFVRSLPIAGVDGTLERRMRGTSAAANARAKTGSFTNARGMAGYVTTRDGENVVFAILANNYAVPVDAIDRASDAVVVALAQFSRR